MLRRRQVQSTTSSSPRQKQQDKQSEERECNQLKRILFFVMLAIILFAIALALWSMISWNRLVIQEPNQQRVGDQELGISEQNEMPKVDLDNTLQVREQRDVQWERDQEERRLAVKGAFLHAWSGYEKYAFEHDELRPCTNDYRDNFARLGATIVDSLDTMLIMGLDKEYERSKNFVKKLNFDRDAYVSLFEMTIRFLGGFLGAYELTGDKMYLQKSEELAERLLRSFKTNSGIPYTLINLKTGDAKNADWHRVDSVLSEVGSIQLEFKALSHHTGNPIYAEKAERIMETIRFSHHKIRKPLLGLYPNYINTETGEFRGYWYSFGALGDSFYEYLLKQYLLTHDHQYLTMYRDMVAGMKQHMLGYSKPSHLAYIGEHRGRQSPKFDHLVCYTPGMLALGSRLSELNNTEAQDHLMIAKQLMSTCVKLYVDQSSGLGPEIANFGNSTHDYNVQHPTYLLRPETVESLFVLYRTTGDRQYVQDAWNIFQALEKHCKTASGYSGVKDVRHNKPELDNAMESFFLSETLKYLYLIFSPETVMSLDEFVLNTEAHPLRPFPKS